MKTILEINNEGCPGMSEWQKSVTLKAIRENKVQGFDCHYIEKPEDMAGTMTPFKPSWNIQYLGDGTQEFFDTIKEAQEWLCSWAVR